MMINELSVAKARTQTAKFIIYISILCVSVELIATELQTKCFLQVIKNDFAAAWIPRPVPEPVLRPKTRSFLTPCLRELLIMFVDVLRETLRETHLNVPRMGFRGNKRNLPLQVVAFVGICNCRWHISAGASSDPASIFGSSSTDCS